MLRARRSNRPSWLLLAALAAFGCRNFDVCGPERPACDPPSAGTGGKPECSAELEDCDGSSLTACETNTRRDPLHCGGCRKPCSDGCAGGRCLDVEKLADDGVIDAGLAVSTDHVYFLARSDTGHTVLRRLTKRTGEVITVLEGLSPEAHRFGGLAVGPDRVYFVENGALKSVLVATQRLTDERVATEVAPVVSDGKLYVWKTDGTLLRRDLISTAEDELAPWPAVALLDLKRVELGALGRSAVVGATIRAGSETRWEVVHVTWPAVERLAEGAGDLVRLHTTSSSEPDVAWLVDRSETHDGTELHAGGALLDPRVIATDPGFTDFCLSTDLIYASFDRVSELGLRAFSRTSPTYAEVGLRRNAAALLCSGGHVYFYDRGARGLFRVNERDLSR